MPNYVPMETQVGAHRDEALQPIVTPVAGFEWDSSDFKSVSNPGVCPSRITSFAAGTGVQPWASFTVDADG
jgi:hypothetical protein